MEKYKFKVKGLDCAVCANRLEEAIQKIDIVDGVTISFMTERLTFTCLEENKAEALEKIKQVIKREEPDVKIEEV